MDSRIIDFYPGVFCPGASRKYVLFYGESIANRFRKAVSIDLCLCVWLLFENGCYSNKMMILHYTDIKGFKSISSQVDWLFHAIQPKAPHNPIGAYFTTLRPDTALLHE